MEASLLRHWSRWLGMHRVRDCHLTAGSSFRDWSWPVLVLSRVGACD